MWAITAAGWLAGLAYYPWLTQKSVSGLTVAVLAMVGAAVSPMIGAGVLSLVAQIQDEVLCNDQARIDAFLPSTLAAATLAFLTVVLALSILTG